MRFQARHFNNRAQITNHPFNLLFHTREINLSFDTKEVIRMLLFILLPSITMHSSSSSGVLALPSYLFLLLVYYFSRVCTLQIRDPILSLLSSIHISFKTTCLLIFLYKFSVFVRKFLKISRPQNQTSIIYVIVFHFLEFSFFLSWRIHLIWGQKILQILRTIPKCYNYNNNNQFYSNKCKSFPQVLRKYFLLLLYYYIL